MRLILLMTAVALASFLPLDLVIAAPAAGGVAASDIGRTALILTILAIPIVAACEAVVNLQQFVTRDLDPTEPAIITVGKIAGGTTTNIIPDRVTFEGTVRTLSPNARKLVRECFERRGHGIASAAGCSFEVNWIDGYPATINDPAMADYVAKVARQALGDDRFIPAARATMGGEDFAYYLEQVPGCFFLVGVQPHGRDDYPSLHNDHFDFTDDAIAVGVRMFVELVMNFRT
jgi:amidohydrolase